MRVYTRVEAARLMGYTYRHTVRLLNDACLPYRNGRGGTRLYDAAAVDEWWRQYQLRDCDRAANLFSYRHRATDAEGDQVCPGVHAAPNVPPCGQPLGRTEKGRLRRLCDQCRVVADREKVKRHAMREAALRARKNGTRTKR